MSSVLEDKTKTLSFSHPGKAKAYEFIVANPGLDYGAYSIKSEDGSLDEKGFDEVLRAIRVSESEAGQKKSQGESAMANEKTTTAAPKKRGRSSRIEEGR